MRSEEQLSCQSHNYHNERSMRYLPRKEGLASISQSCDAWLFCLILGYLCGIIIACAIVVTKLSGACAANRDAGLDRDNWCRRGCGMACGVLPPRLCRRADFRGPLGRSGLRFWQGLQLKQIGWFMRAHAARSLRTDSDTRLPHHSVFERPGPGDPEEGKYPSKI